MKYRGVTIDPACRLEGEKNTGFGWMRFSASLDLLWISEALDVPGPHRDLIWDRQDGFGISGIEAGDWSGIRDSTDDAKADMLAIAQAALPADRLFATLGVPVPAHLTAR